MRVPPMADLPAAADRRISNVVIVHGAFADGSAWRRVYELLKIQGFSVSLVQNPLTSLEDDVAATRRILDRQSGPTILVGHSYGGTIITEAGNHSKVTCLVYIAAFAPDSGQSTLDQYCRVPPPACFRPEVQPDGFAFLRRETFAAACAGQASDAESEFLFDSQVPVAVKSLEGRIKDAAWKRKPSWYVVANGDEAIDPVLLRQTALRIGARTTEISGGYMIFLSQPDAIAAVIVEASFATRDTDNDKPT